MCIYSQIFAAMSSKKRESSPSSGSGSDSDSDSSSSSSSSSGSSSTTSESSKRSGSIEPNASSTAQNESSKQKSPEPKKSPEHSNRSPPRSRESSGSPPPKKSVNDATSAEVEKPIEQPSTDQTDSRRSRSPKHSKPSPKRSVSRESGELNETIDDPKENDINNKNDEHVETNKESIPEKRARSRSRSRRRKSRSRSNSKTRRSRSPGSKTRRSRSRGRRDKSNERRRERSRSRDRRRDKSMDRNRRDRSVDRRRDRSRNGNRSRDRSQHRRDRSNDRRHDRTNDRRRNRSSDRRRDGDKNRRSDKERSVSKEPEKNNPEAITKKEQKTVDILTSKTGGAYIPPAKLRALQAAITDKSSAAYQRIAWEALKKSIHGFINKVNVDNIGIITRQLLKENIVRGRGLLSRSIIQAQSASPTFTHVYAALVAVINSKFPNIGELLLHRLIIQFKRGYRRNDKTVCISATRFMAHLINQGVAHEILALEILTLLVEVPTDDSVEVAIAFLKECGMKLQEVSAKGINAIFEMLKNILHEGKLDKRVQYMIEVIFQVRKDGFKDHVAVSEALGLVEENDQYTHLIMLDEATDTQDILSKCDSKRPTNALVK